MDQVLQTYTVDNNKEIPRFNTFDYWECPGWRERAEDYTLDDGMQSRNEFS